MVDLYTGTVPNLTQSQPEFDTNTQGILDYIAGLAPQLNEWVGAYVQDTTSASTTSNTIGTGSKTFTVESGKGYKVNMTVRASATSGNYMDGIVTAYSGTSLNVNFTASSGSGTFTSWQIFLSIPGSSVTLGSNTFTGDQFVPDEAYDASGWNGDLSVPTKNAVRDKIELLLSSYVTETSDPSYADDTSNPASTDWVNGKALITQRTTITTSGSASYDFNSIPAGVKEVNILFNIVSTNGTSPVQIQLGTSSGVETTGYISASSNLQNTASVGVSTSTTGFHSAMNLASEDRTGLIRLCLLEGSNTWICSSNLVSNAGLVVVSNQAGSKTLSAVLDRLRITTINGTDLFDGGSASISYKR